MKATACSVNSAVNIYAPVPVIVFTLEIGGLADWPTGRLGRKFIDGLLANAPELADQAAPDGHDGGLVDAMADGDGLSLALVQANLSVALQRAAGADVSFAATAPAEEPELARTIFAYEDVEVGVKASGIASHMICRLLPAECGVAFKARLELQVVLKQLSDLATSTRLNETTRDIVRLAGERGIPWFRVAGDGGAVQLGQGRYSRLIAATEMEDIRKLDWRTAEDGGGPDVAERCVNRLFPPGSPSRVPIAAITGTSGKTTTTRMVAAILEQAGFTVGMANTYGIHIGGARVADGDHAGFSGARVILSDRWIDAAVLETARGGIIRSGLAFDRCDVGAVLNVGHEHVGQDGVTSVDQLAEIKSLIVRVASRCAVLNADDTRCVAMSEHVAAPICFVSTAAENEIVAAHVASGGTAALLKAVDDDNLIALVDSGEETALLDANDIPAVLGGGALHMAQNAVFAAAIARGLGVANQAIRDALGTFACSIDVSPGRMNVYDGHGFKVVLDWGNNPYAVKVLCDVMERLAAGGRLICMMSFGGNRPDWDYREVARILAGRFDHIVCSDKQDLESRPPGEVPKLFYETLRDCGMPAARLTLASDQRTGVDAALGQASAGDCVWISTDAFEDVWRQIVDFQPA